jgi:hypothetical protein
MGLFDAIAGLISANQERIEERQAVDRQNDWNKKMYLENRDYERANFLENRGYERGNYLTDRAANRADFLENRMYEKQLWQEQNTYNSPEQQMQRLKAAGLNPMLVYGHGAANIAASPQGGNAPASIGSGSGSPPGADAPRSDRAHPRYPQVNIGEIADYYRIKNLDEQNESIRAQREEVETRTKMLQRDYKILQKTDGLPIPLRSTDPWQVQMIARGLNAGKDFTESDLGKKAFEGTTGVIKGAKDYSKRAGTDMNKALGKSAGFTIKKLIEILSGGLF